MGSHGGTWINNANSDEELDMQLAAAPVYNFAKYQVLPLGEVSDPDTVLRRLTALASIRRSTE